MRENEGQRNKPSIEYNLESDVRAIVTTAHDTSTRAGKHKHGTRQKIRLPLIVPQNLLQGSLGEPNHEPPQSNPLVSQQQSGERRRVAVDGGPSTCASKWVSIVMNSVG